MRNSLDGSFKDDVRKEALVHAVELRKWFTEPVVLNPYTVHFLCCASPFSHSPAIPALFDETGLWKCLLKQSNQMMSLSSLSVGQVLMGMLS